MIPADPAAPAGNVFLAEIGAFTLTVLAGVIVSLVTLWLAGRQRTRQETHTEARRRETVLAAIGRELASNRVATRGKLNASNAHITVGALTTVAFERHAGELATIAPESIADVYEHYTLVRLGAGGHPRPGPTGNPRRPATTRDLD